MSEPKKPQKPATLALAGIRSERRKPVDIWIPNAPMRATNLAVQMQKKDGK